MRTVKVLSIQESADVREQRHGHSHRQQLSGRRNAHLTCDVDDERVTKPT